MDTIFVTSRGYADNELFESVRTAGNRPPVTMATKIGMSWNKTRVMLQTRSRF